MSHESSWKEAISNIGDHAKIQSSDIRGSSRPIEFQAPIIHRCQRMPVTAYDPKNGQYHRLENVLARGSNLQDAQKSFRQLGIQNSNSNFKDDDSLEDFETNSDATSEICYYIKRKIATSIYGSVYKGVKLKRREALHGETLLNGMRTYPLDVIVEDDDFEYSKSRKRDMPNKVIVNDFKFQDDGSIWELTKSVVVIKISCWKKIRRLRGKHLEDPLKEIQAMQLIGNYNHNIRGSIIALQDDEYLYSIMEYLKDGDLYSAVMKEISLNERLKERTARRYFRQILLGLHHLQQKGVCHRDLRLENIMVHSKKIQIIDFGLAIRVPYENTISSSSATDVSSGTLRMRISGQGQCGDLNYICPEVLERKDFDGFAMDLWSAGVILYIMVIGRKPFHWAHSSDEQFMTIAVDGELRENLKYWNIHLSDNAIDLLQHMLWKDENKRLSLAQIMRHPWVTFEEPMESSPLSAVSQSSISSCSTFSTKSREKTSFHDKWLSGNK